MSKATMTEERPKLVLTGDTADEQDVAFADLPILEATTTMLTEAEALTAALAEIRDRLTAGRLDDTARDDLRADVLATAERFHAFALFTIANQS